MAATTTMDRTLAALERMTLDELHPGDELPSESALARELDVSRLTVREAIRTLAARGHVDVRGGRRSVVRELEGDAVGEFFRATVRRDATALLELLELRRALEVHIAALAAEHSTPSDLAALETANAAMRADAADADLFNAADVAYHEALAAASGNTMLARLLRQLAGAMLESRRASYEGGHARGGSPEEAIGAHEKIAERVRARDAAGAAEAMRAHLVTTERDLRASLDA